MELQIIISIISPIMFIVGLFTGHWLTSRREFNNKRREIRVQYLIQAYRSIASAANRQGTMTDEQRLKIESAIEDIQLLGDEEQLKVLNNMISNRDNDFVKVLEILRNDLRQELDIKKVDYPLRFYRMNRG